MAIPARITQYLEENNIKYLAVTHPEAFTAQEVAHSIHVSGRELAKTVVIRANDSVFVVVLPAHHQINMAQLAETIGLGEVVLVSEAELKGWFPDCETGAMPILGNLYGLPVYVAEPLTRADEIVFNAGSHTDVIKMKFGDFAELVKPTVARFSQVGPEIGMVAQVAKKGA